MDTMTRKHCRGSVFFGVLLGAALALLMICPAFAAGGIWIEGEKPASTEAGSVTPSVENMGRPAYLSGGSWLKISVDPGDVEKSVPAGGVLLTYTFTASETATYNLWNRIGYEKIRSPFQWRIDGGGWTTLLPDANTIDVEELQTWNPVGWLPLGTSALTAGAHTLQIRVPKSKDDKGGPAKLLYVSDALYLTPGTFYPDGPHQPGDPAAESDADKAAAAKVFSVTAPPGAAQTATSLAGDWQIAAADEMVVEDRLGPIASLPDGGLFGWHAIPIPSNRNDSVPELSYVHRYFLRTRAAIPAALANRAMVLHFPSINMAATVFVNGQRCGSTKNQFAAWDCDITAAVKFGKVNEIVVGIKDTFYGLADQGNAPHPQFLPFSFFRYSSDKLDMPVLYHTETGLLRTPTLVTAGPAYTSDVFALPSVKAKTLGLEVTVHNPAATPVTVSVANRVVPFSGGPAEKTFAPQQITVPAGQDAVLKLSEGWANPKLWWPDTPNQYTVVTTLSIDGAAVDERTTRFGFREWGWMGRNFTLNGVPWHGREDTTPHGSPESVLATYRKHNQTMMRFWYETSDMEDRLDFADAHGMVIRRTGIFDGEGGAGFYNVHSEPLWDNYRAQLAAWIKSQRNHPSVFIWSVENEITFINGHVFGNDDVTTRQHHKTAVLVRDVDPTRPLMVDGGNALLDESLPVYGGHYLDPPFPALPAGAYDKAGFMHRQVWPITQDKPILLGETYYAAGIDVSDIATLYGEAAFVGKAEARPGVALIADILSQGYRWNDINFDLYYSSENNPFVSYNSWKPIAALVRQWDSVFSSGQKVVRTVGLFNDTRTPQPISLHWTLTVGGKNVASQTSLHTVAAGANQKFDVTLPLPPVVKRQEGTWTLALSVQGKPVFTDTKPISILRPALPASKALGAVGAVAVYDPNGSAAAFLTRAGVAFRRIASLSAAPASAKVLVVGKDALTPAQSVSSQLAAYASAGRVVVVLEQKNPLHYQAIPGAISVDANTGSAAFLEDPASPILRGLKANDFFVWGEDGIVYKDAYLKPTSGGRSLIQCHDKLQETALAQMTAGRGLLLLSQLVIGQKVATSPVAQQLLLNMVSYGQRYQQVFAPVVAVTAGNAPLSAALDASGLHYTKASDPIAALGTPKSLVILDATPAHLKALAAQPAKVAAFTRSGGWIVFNNLTADGLAEYNKLVGVAHLIRPYKQEKVTWPAIHNRLTAGLATSNIVLGSGKQIFDYEAGEYPDKDGFSAVVDYEDVAPFGKSAYGSWDNITNNYTMNDGFWPLIINQSALSGGKPVEVPITLPRPEKIVQFTWVSDTNYRGTTKVELTFDGKDKTAFATEPNGDFQTFPLSPPRPAQTLTLTVADWQHDPTHPQGDRDLIGIDNIYLKAYRSPEFYRKVKPMLNIGALVEYPQGLGGMVLCNVKFQAQEGNPVNAVKKQTILATILRNLNAPFSGSRTVIAGASTLRDTPLDLSRQANQYLSDRGWFGDKAFSFSDLPRGKQTFAGVRYNVFDFATSPVPSVIMLGGSGIPGSLPDSVAGIPVGRKADALFFLQAARIDSRRSGDEVKKGRRYEMADYVVHYADGQTLKVPVYAEISVDSYRQKVPAALPEAQIAWTKPYPGTDESAVAYSMQWNNPRPDVEIQSLDVTYGPDRRGVLALLAVTAATEGK